ncbi:UDP-N-acetylglucosamine 2-epimerase [Leptospira jelokensis]|uniref:UDP-N-acetylglucosamine 2-epimerase n=1 Tax=Leptospira jelokensis TaxID=2484931 RepID=UPI001091542D|nr:UDP-N-acetylglucosamine 2-epimerase [Leptospira jelokensis]TGL99205.1 UDP-N-acetylglucosamine 2-epimerase (hydrolyzing) [Leptospira jelokensis]
MKQKICVVTGTRAEYGLLSLLLHKIKKSNSFELQIIATGMHLSPEFGSTYIEIEKEGFKIDRKVEILLSADTASSISKSIGLGCIGFAEAFENLAPDLLLVLGDRYEILSAAISALIFRIPICHIHGGELTEGAYDDAIRHSITKMSAIHFVAAEEYRNRVIQLGESPQHVYEVGGLGVDTILNLPLLSLEDLERELNFKFGKRNLLITYHPETMASEDPSNQFSELLLALKKLENTNFIFTYPNSDTGGRKIIKMIDDFVGKNKNARSFVSLGQTKYFSCIRYVDAVVGNSSSGLLEVPSFKKGTINIGDRQKGRLRAKSVIDVPCDSDSIYNGILEIYSKEFQAHLSETTNPYGLGNASDQILQKLMSLNFSDFKSKKFYDLSFEVIQ